MVVEIIGTVKIVGTSDRVFWIIGASNGAVWIVGTNEGGKRKSRFIDGVGSVGSIQLSRDIDGLRQPLVRI